MDSILVKSKKRLIASIIGITLFTFFIVMSVIYKQPLSVVIFSTLFGFFLLIFLVQILKRRGDPETQRKLSEQRMAELRAQHPKLGFFFKYNVLFANIPVMVLSGFFIVSSLKADVAFSKISFLMNSFSMIFFPMIFGVSLFSLLVFYPRERRTEKK